tara:strand:- start:206 stop:562 length:357 start_codon:yes stop_codon:yes gene_type:complete
LNGSKVNKIINQKQKDFFKVLFECGDLLFQSEKKGSYSADMKGKFFINEMVDEDRLDIDDDTHIHVNWEDVCSVEIGVEKGEGLVSVKDRKNEVLFNFYNFSGSFPEEVKAFEGSLVD